MPYQQPTTSKKDDFKFRIMKVKNRIKVHHPHYINPFIEQYPQYANDIQRIRNVFALITADEQMTSDLEQFANDLDNGTL